MSMPSLPDWLPWWVPILVAIPVGLWVLTMLVMPFSVIGTKSRLEAIEARLDEIQGEIRSLVLRLPESPAERLSYRPDYAPPRADVVDDAYIQPAPARPPIPPQPRADDFIPRVAREPEISPRPRPEDRGQPPPRSEPRIDWRR